MTETQAALKGWTGVHPSEGGWASGAPAPEAFVTLLRRHGDRVYNFARRLAGNDADAADLVQEAFVRAFQARNRYDPSRPFDTWVMSILHNLFVDRMRRYERKHAISLDAPKTDSGGWEEVLRGQDPDPQESAAREEEADLAQRALDTLPPLYRSAVVMCDVEGLSYDDIARACDCPVGTVRSRLHQGRVMLREAFRTLEGDPS